MATFDDDNVGTSAGGTTPTYGQQKRSAPNVRTVQFADGYEHRIIFGLAQHQNPKIFNLTFEKSQSDAQKIEDFFDARANANFESFGYQPAGESSTSKFVCENWTKTIPYLNRATIKATFREVFESS